MVNMSDGVGSVSACYVVYGLIHTVHLFTVQGIMHAKVQSVSGVCPECVIPLILLQFATPKV